MNKTPTPRIIFEDTHLVVLSKPAGLLSQGESTGDENLVDWCRTYFGRNYVGLVHRLDRNTSGIMVVAKRSKAAERLSESLKSGELERTYLAWVQGSLAAPARWEHVLEKDERTNTVRVVREKTSLSDSAGSKSSTVSSTSAQSGISGKPSPSGKSNSNTLGKPKAAILSVRPVSSGRLGGEALSLVEFQLETGRSHQIRVQSSHEGFPLVGDVKYGGKKLVGACRDFGRPALHSHRLSFPHPMTKEKLEFEDPLPEDMKALVGK